MDPLTEYRCIAVFCLCLLFGHLVPVVDQNHIELTHIGVYFIRCASQKTQKHSINRQYWQTKGSQENLGTLISGVICDSKLIFRVFQSVTHMFRHAVLP